jgi:hypothetical protein
MEIVHMKLNHPSPNMFVQNFGIHLQEYVVSLPRRPLSWYKNLFLYIMVGMYLCLVFPHDVCFGKVSVVVLGKFKQIFILVFVSIFMFFQPTSLNYARFEVLAVVLLKTPKSSEMWCCVTGWVVPNIWKDCGALIFSIKQCKKNSSSQKTWVFKFLVVCWLSYASF